MSMKTVMSPLSSKVDDFDPLRVEVPPLVAGTIPLIFSRDFERENKFLRDFNQESTLSDLTHTFSIFSVFKVKTYTTFTLPLPQNRLSICIVVDLVIGI